MEIFGNFPLASAAVDECMFSITLHIISKKKKKIKIEIAYEMNQNDLWNPNAHT